jgi:hypothetical protein
MELMYQRLWESPCQLICKHTTGLREILKFSLISVSVLPINIDTHIICIILITKQI